MEGEGGDQAMMGSGKSQGQGTGKQLSPPHRFSHRSLGSHQPFPAGFLNIMVYVTSRTFPHPVHTARKVVTLHQASSTGQPATHSQEKDREALSFSIAGWSPGAECWGGSAARTPLQKTDPRGGAVPSLWLQGQGQGLAAQGSHAEPQHGRKLTP